MSQSPSVPRTRRELAALVDHTLLRPETTAGEVRRLCREALDLSVCAVCVNATMASIAAAELRGSDVRLATVIGFPSGAHRTDVKALEAERAVAEGADELDMVINLSPVRAGDWRLVVSDIAGVRAAAPEATLKVIVEAGVLGPQEIAGACRASEEAGAQLVKTSTGFHPSGGATVEHVRTMAEVVGGRLGIKASGGIRSADAALALIEAGATRLGLSATAAVLAGMPE